MKKTPLPRLPGARPQALLLLFASLLFSQAYYPVPRCSPQLAPSSGAFTGLEPCPQNILSEIAKEVGVSVSHLKELNPQGVRPNAYLLLPEPVQLKHYVAVIPPGTPLTSLSSKAPFATLPFAQLDPLSRSGSEILLEHFSGQQFLARRDQVYLIYSTSRTGHYLQAPFFEYLLQFLGTPYAFGGEDFRTGIDCSFFVKSSFSSAGYLLPRTSREQYLMGVPIRTDQLLPGDLVFFSNNGKAISHVGIYWDRGKFLHATSRGGVKFSLLSEPYYREHLAGARRIL